MTNDEAFSRREARRSVIFEAAAIRKSSNITDVKETPTSPHLDSAIYYSSPNNSKLYTSINNNESPDLMKDKSVVGKDSLLMTPTKKTYSSSFSDDRLTIARISLAFLVGTILRINVFHDGILAFPLILVSWMLYELCIEVIAYYIGLVKLSNYPSHGHTMDVLLALIGPGCPLSLVMFTGRVMDACNRWSKDTVSMCIAFICAGFLG